MDVSGFGTATAAQQLEHYVKALDARSTILRNVSRVRRGVPASYNANFARTAYAESKTTCGHPSVFVGCMATYTVPTFTTAIVVGTGDNALIAALNAASAFWHTVFC
jgi:hypothetical protein